MSERVKINRYQQKINQKHSSGKPISEQYRCLRQRLSLVAGTPFRPRMQEHAAALSQTGSENQRSGFVLDLQRTYGNSYVQRLLSSLTIQAKLTVGAPNDIYEQEADRVAERVVNRINSQLQLQRDEEEIQTKKMPQLQRRGEEEIFRIHSTEDSSLEISGGLEHQIHTASGKGEVLPARVRGPMERAFGADFSGIRVHTGASADALNRSLQARAFTNKKDIYFRNGEYNPYSSSGQKLIAHELTHTLQQGANQRVSCWFATGHELLTRLAALKLQKSMPIDDKVIDFLAERSGDLDATPRSVQNLIKGSLFASPKARKEYSKQELEKKLVIWQENSTHQRNEKELPLHGEAGYYKKAKQSGMVSANKEAVFNLLKEAEANYTKGKQKEALMKLSYALHAAEDRGAHGEGQEFKGHDPRISQKEMELMPTQQGMVPNPYYNPKWNPDDPTWNPVGWKLGIEYAEEVLQHYYWSIKSNKSIAEEPLATLGLSSKEAKWRENPKLAAIMSLGGPVKEVNKLMQRQKKLMRLRSDLLSQMTSQKKRVGEINLELDSIKNQFLHNPAERSAKDLQKRQAKLTKEKAALTQKMKAEVAKINAAAKELKEIKEKLEKLTQGKEKQLNTPGLRFPTERQYE